MTSENNLEKSSQDYKKSQYGSWYKKSAEKKKNIPEEKENSLIKKFIKFFKNKWMFFQKNFGEHKIIIWLDKP